MSHPVRLVRSGAHQSQAGLPGPDRQVLGAAGLQAALASRGEESTGPVSAEQGEKHESALNYYYYRGIFYFTLVVKNKNRCKKN